MFCHVCEKWEEIGESKLPYVVRTCPDCKRKIKTRELGESGKGLKIREGDQFVIPKGFIRVSANPLKGVGTLYRPGLSWFAELVFGVDLAQQKIKDDFGVAIENIIAEMEATLKNSQLLRGVDFTDSANAEEVFNILSENRQSPEWSGYLAAGLAAAALAAIKEGDASTAAWAMACSQRFQSLTIFRVHFEEVVFMGQSARRIIDLLSLWDSNKENRDEGFWQSTLSDHSFALAQLFSVPVTFIKDNAYVGGARFDRQDARLLDFLASGGSAEDAILMEIKTPTTPLLGRRYRKNVFAPSADLSGAIVQVRDYRRSLQRNIDSLKPPVEAFSPKCVLIIGSHASELETETKKRSFELFRSGLTDVDVVTFDELFLKIENLAKLFGLIRAEPATR